MFADSALHTVHTFIYYDSEVSLAKDGKAAPATSREGPQGRETSRLPHFLDNRLTDGGNVVSLTRRPPLTSRKIPGAHFC
jgi:hypothetical protein